MQKKKKKSRHREMQWVSREGEPSLEKMTSEDTCLTQVHGIVAGETPNVRDLSFRDPDCFQSGQWLEHGVDVKNLLSPLRDHLWVSSMRARNPRLEFLRKFIPTKNK